MKIQELFKGGNINNSVEYQLNNIGIMCKFTDMKIDDQDIYIRTKGHVKFINNKIHNKLQPNQA